MTTETRPRHPTGIRPRHSRACPSRHGRRCRCRPTWEAWVWSRRDGRKISKTFPTRDAAKAWRADATGAVRKGAMRAPATVTLREAADEWLRGAEEGRILTRSGDPYKPSAIRSYRGALDLYILDDLGGAKLSAVTLRDVQDLADRLRARGLDPSTIRNAIMPLRAIYRRAVRDGIVAVNPTAGLELPAVRGRRDRIASPQEAAKLLAALPEPDRALWATAFYGGLRRGELGALDLQHVDLGAGVIRVERAWDAKERVYVEPKSRAGRRTVPIPVVLRDHLDEHVLRLGWREGLIFGRTAESPFDASTVQARADAAWEKAGLERITLHEARHTFASLMIAAGVGSKVLSTLMGHASVAITLDRYAKLFEAQEREAAGLLDAYLARADTAARLAQVVGEPTDI
jgi:integrase